MKEQFQGQSTNFPLNKTDIFSLKASYDQYHNILNFS